MNRIVGRIAVASSFLVMGGLAVGPAASAAPTLIPRHEASTRVAPEPGPGSGDASSSTSCGAGRFAVNCAVALGAPVPVAAPAAAQHALDAEVSSVAVSTGGSAESAVQAPVPAMHAMFTDMTDAPAVPVLPDHMAKRY
jgi:hypothetical protein